MQREYQKHVDRMIDKTIVRFELSTLNEEYEEVDMITMHFSDGTFAEFYGRLASDQDYAIVDCTYYGN